MICLLFLQRFYSLQTTEKTNNRVKRKKERFNLKTGNNCTIIINNNYSYYYERWYKTIVGTKH